MKKRELYKILGVPPEASEEELKGAFRHLAKHYHPDVSRMRESSEMFSRVVNAYKTLIAENRNDRLIDFPVRNHTHSPFTSRANPPQDIFKLGQMLLSSKNPGIRAFAARGLGNSRKKSSYAFLRKALSDRNESVVKSVVKAIGELKIYQSAGELGALFAHSSRGIKLIILENIERYKLQKGFKNILITAMKDQDFEIRKKALHLFAHYKG